METAEEELAKFSDESEEMMKMSTSARTLAKRITDDAEVIVKNADEARKAAEVIILFPLLITSRYAGFC